MKHTPGPWNQSLTNSVWREAHSIANEDGEVIAHTTRGWGEQMQLANARLIASAPDLYELAILVSNGMVDAESLRMVARAAIKKAKGE